MENASKLVSSVAALVGALAWPGMLTVALVLLRKELRQLLLSVSSALGKVRKASLAGMIFELDQLAEAEARDDAEKGGKITPRQVQAGARIKIEADKFEPQAITEELDKLCLEYDGLRRTMRAGPERTRAMTGLVVKMRTLAQSAISCLKNYQSSGSPGSRLAAVTMMQMVPQSADLSWLVDRFRTEQPFIFYHAALALQNVANVSKSTEDKKILLEAASDALATVRSHSERPDQNTINVLSALIESVE